jgi:uncharacterized protein YjbI with pentapeptide repeats
VGRKKLVRKVEPPSKRGIAWPRWTGFRGMTVRSWLELLVVPLALVVIGFLFSVQQDARQQRIENQRAEAERELAVQRAQDEALQAYLDQMSGLLLERDLRASESGSEVRTLARARTLTVLSRFDPSGKTAVMQFLVEANLVQGAGREPIIDLRDAYLSHADLTGANLRRAYLSHAYLYDASLSHANLGDAYLGYAYLSGADLGDAYLGEANLSGVLGEANLRRANLRRAEGITNEELERKAASLNGATMPNGQTYEDWLKDKKAGEKDKKNE